MSRRLRITNIPLHIVILQVTFPSSISSARSNPGIKILAMEEGSTKPRADGGQSTRGITAGNKGRRSTNTTRKARYEGNSRRRNKNIIPHSHLMRKPGRLLQSTRDKSPSLVIRHSIIQRHRKKYQIHPPLTMHHARRLQKE